MIDCAPSTDISGVVDRSGFRHVNDIVSEYPDCCRSSRACRARIIVVAGATPTWVMPNVANSVVISSMVGSDGVTRIAMTARLDRSEHC